MTLPSPQTSLPSVHPSILREYDIRGVVGETLSEQDAYLIGKAFASVVAEQHESQDTPVLAVARDGRLSSPFLEEALVKGICDAGVNVIRIGVGPTPMLYFAVRHMETAGGIMVTGSHNPPNHNGFKFVCGKLPFYGEAIQALGARISEGRFTQGAGKEVEEGIAFMVNATYTTVLEKAYQGKEALNVVWDPGHGAAANIVQALSQNLPGTHHVINGVIDGTFPAHHPDPTVPKNLVQLIETVKEKGASIGIAFDGDGDRLGVVDGEGRMLFGDQLLLLLASDLLKTHPGATIIADVKASQHLFDGIRKLGGNAIMWKTGHSLIKAKMLETGAILAGEMSGHVFFADRYFGYDDGVYAAVRVLDMLARTGEPLSAMVDRLPVAYNTPELRIACPDTRKFAVIEEVKARLRAEGSVFEEVDGVRVLLPEGWWLLRASNTQPALVARCETWAPETLKKVQEALQAALAASNVAMEVMDH